MPSGELCVMLMKPPTCSFSTSRMISAYAGASVAVKLPWYVAKISWPAFSSRVILPSVVSTHWAAAGDNFCAGFADAALFFAPDASFVEEEGVEETEGAEEVL